jgi:hypothetical protein
VRKPNVIPTPWVVRLPLGEYYTFRVLPAAEAHDIDTKTDTRYRQFHYATAKLIAAAPNLFDACEAALEYLRWESERVDSEEVIALTEQLDQALDKAKNGSIKWPSP